MLKAAPCIYVMDADGSDPTLLVKDELGAGGMQLVARRDEDSLPRFLRRRRRRLSEGGRQALSEGDLQKAQDMLDKLRVEQNSTEVYIINADGSGRTALTSYLADDASPHWSPDGTKIILTDGVCFDANAEGEWEIAKPTIPHPLRVAASANLAHRTGAKREVSVPVEQALACLPCAS
jgi:hypothetical protein